MTKLLHAELTGKIIKAYYRVYNGLSQTHPEFIFERAMIRVLENMDVPCVQQDQYQIFYKNRLVGLQRLDIFVADKVVVELKVADTIQPIHLAQLISYIKTVGKDVGLLLRFGGPEPEFARRVLSEKAKRWERNPQIPDDLEKSDELLYPELIYEIAGSLMEVHNTLGPGFIARIYAKASLHEAKLRGLDPQYHQGMHVYFEGDDLGEIKFNHFQIEDKLLVFPFAIRSLDQIHLENLKEWMRHLNIPVGVLVNFSALSLEPVILRI